MRNRRRWLAYLRDFNDLMKISSHSTSISYDDEPLHQERAVTLVCMSTWKAGCGLIIYAFVAALWGYYGPGCTELESKRPRLLQDGILVGSKCLTTMPGKSPSFGACVHG